MQKIQLEEMIGRGYSIRRMSRETGKAATTVRFWLDKYGLKTKGVFRKVRRWKDEEMIELIAGSTTISDVLRGIGLSVRPGNYDTVRSFIREHGLDISHMTGKSSGRGGNRIDMEDVFVVGSRIGRGTVKKLIETHSLLGDVCAICGQDKTWNGKPLVFVLDHINGVNNDNRLENLRMLCPNCNSQQDTFCRKN